MPYFFTESLMARGLRVNRVALEPHPRLRWLFDRTVLPIARRMNPHTTYEYFRSSWHYRDMRSAIRRAVRAHPDSDAFIFMTFSFSSSGLTPKPTILFCDWTYEFYFRYFLEREPDWFERQSVKRDLANIEKADGIFVLWPDHVQELEQRHHGSKVFYLGNVINSLCDVNREDALALKKQHESILFIGVRRYLAGARTLIQAFDRLRHERPRLTLDIVGMRAEDIGYVPDGVTCHGFLNKDRESDRARYHALLKRARLFVNTTPKWASFQASVEAMYFYTPVIVTPYRDFVATFGEDLTCGYYCEENTPERVEQLIRRAFNSPDYETQCLNAHAAVQDFTWEAFTGNMLRKIEAITQPSTDSAKGA